MEEIKKRTVHNAPYIQLTDVDPTNGHTTFEVEDRLLPLLDILRVRHPKWMFEGNLTITGGHLIRGVCISLNDEMLGRVRYDSYYGFVIHNKRIEDSMERKSDKTTAKADTAKRIIEKYFRPKDHLERMREITGKAKKLAAEYSTTVGCDKRRATQTFQRIVWKEAFADIPATMARLNIPENAEDGAGNVVKLQARSEEADKLYAQIDTSKGVYILDMGSRVLTYEYDPEGKLAFAEYEKTNIPQEIKASYGMLKIVADGDTLPDIGVRISDKEYFICKKDKPDAKTEG